MKSIDHTPCNALHSDKQGFAATIDALNLPGDLAYISDFMKADGKTGLSIAAACDARRLKKLARFMGCTQSGNQQEVFNRLFIFKTTWLFIRSHTAESLGKFSNAELNRCLDAAQKAIKNFTNKPQKIIHLIAWTAGVLQSIQTAAALEIQMRFVREAFVARQPIGIDTAKSFEICTALETWGYERIGEEYRHNGSVAVAFEFDGKVYPPETFNRLIEATLQQLTWKQNGLATWWGRYSDYHPGGNFPDRDFASAKFPIVKQCISEQAQAMRELETRYIKLLDILNGQTVTAPQILFQDEMPLLHHEAAA